MSETNYGIGVSRIMTSNTWDSGVFIPKATNTQSFIDADGWTNPVVHITIPTNIIISISNGRRIWSGSQTPAVLMPDPSVMDYGWALVMMGILFSLIAIRVQFPSKKPILTGNTCASMKTQK